MTDSSNTIQIIVIDEKGNKSNCKLYRNEKLSEILKKYNSRVATNFDAIMFAHSLIPLHKTPAQLGLHEGDILEFCQSASTTPVASSGAPPPLTSVLSSTNLASGPLPSSSATSSASTSTSSSTTGAVSMTEVTQLRERIATLQAEMALKKQFYEQKCASLENKLTEEQEKTQCRICFEKDRNTLIFPCLHFNYCGTCLEEHSLRTKECPSCRTHIAGVLKLQFG